MASSWSSGGRMPGRRRASIVLPAPGGPTNSRWCPPAAASSSARRASGWPRTSAMSGDAGGGWPATGSRWSGHGSSPRKASTSSASVSTARTLCRPTSSASRADATATTTSSASTTSTMGTVPGTARTAPSRPSSPRKPTPSTRSGSSCSDATSTPTAIARSSPLPPLRVPDGARLTVIRRVGQSRPLDSSADRTRSRASRHDASGKPTTAKPGRPFETWTSTLMGRPSTPSTVAVGTMASIGSLLLWNPPAPRLVGRRGRLTDRPRSWGHGSRGV